MQPGQQFVQYFQHSTGPEPTGNRLFTAMHEGQAVGHIGLYRRVSKLGKDSDPEALPLESDRRYDHPGTPWSVGSMYVSPGHEHIVPTLLGLAMEHSMRTSPAGTSRRMPEASRDLSKHSRRLVTKLVGYGVIDDPNAGTYYPANSITREQAQSALSQYTLPDHAEKVSSNDADRAGRHLRSIIARHRRENRPEHKNTPLFNPEDVPVHKKPNKPSAPPKTTIL